MRTRKKAWTEKELATNNRIVHEPTLYKGEWKNYFKNENAVHLEIGCGKGSFITKLAAINKHINYIAMERDPHIIVSGARAARELDCSLAFILADVKNITEYFESEIELIYINFCDPWPNRKKWAKRRLTHGNFLDMYCNILCKHGKIFLKTDNTELFEFSLEQFIKKGFQLSNISQDLHRSNYTENIMTEYEIKFSQKGMPIYRCEAAL